MDYITTAEAGKKWGITSNRVFILARDGRIPGALQISSRWMIPSNAEKPADGRTKEAKLTGGTRIEPDFFRYPSFEYKDPFSFNPPLYDEELAIKSATEAFFACRFEECDMILGTLPKNCSNRYIRIVTFYEKCMASITLNKPKHFFYSYGKLLSEFQNDFPHRKEMQEYIHKIDATLGSNAYYSDKFHVDPEYAYHESFIPHLTALCSISLSFAREKLTLQKISTNEINCILLKNLESPSDLQTIHTYLASAYAFMGINNKMIYHIKEALSLAEKYELFYIPASEYYYMKNLYEPAFDGFSDDFKKKMLFLSDDIHERYVRFMNSTKKSSIYSLLSHKNFLYVFYVSLGYSNEEIAHQLHVSVGTVGKTLSSIYDIIGVKGKKELAELYQNSISESFL